MIWSVDNSHRYVIRTWADEAVVNDVVSGDTHFLEPLATELLRCLQTSPATQDALIQGLSEAFIFPPESDVVALAESTLAKLQGIGLIATAL